MTIYIHKGDSTIFADVKRFLTFYINTPLRLQGWTARFILGGIIKDIEDISTKSFEVVLSADETNQLRYGTLYGSVILMDSEGNTKTVVNTIPFEITSKVVENESQIIDLTIPESAEIDIKLQVGSSGGGDAMVYSVNGMLGDVVLTAEDVGALPDTTVIPDTANLVTKQELSDELKYKQPIGDYLTEIPEEYVKKTDYATKDTYGIVRINTNGTYGIGMNDSVGLYIASATDRQVEEKANSNKAITPKILDLAVKTGVTTNTIELTADEKANAKAWLGYAEPTDIIQAIAAIPQFKLSIVDSLPTAGEKMTLYLVPKEGTDNDVYDEYIWIEQTESFEHLGTTAVDLTDYVKNTDYATGTVSGVVKASSTFAIESVSGFLRAVPTTVGTKYDNLSQYGFIGKGTLDNVLTQYYTKSEIDTTIGDINTILDQINGEVI